MNAASNNDPLLILGIAGGAGEAEIRDRYLQLVKQFPPDRNPEKFREIRAAFDAAMDPLLIARRLVEPPDPEHPPEWSQTIEAQRKIPPPLSPAFLLSLGNRESQAQAPSNSPQPEPVKETLQHSVGQNP